MFTGIVETTKKIELQGSNPPSPRLRRAKEKNIRIAISLDKKWKLKIGDSVAISGVCLTVAEILGKKYFFDIIPETLSKTIFGKSIPEYVNIERPLVYGARVHGHLVSGHVNCIGNVLKVSNTKNGYRIEIGYPKKFKKYVIEKGSIVVDGASLTIASVKGSSFSIALVPHTLKITTLSNLKKGAMVNLEFDLLHK